MRLQYPVQISSRLLPSVTVGDVTISIERDEYATAYNSPDGRDVFKYYLDGMSLEYVGDDLKSGCQGCTLREALISLLSFLSCGDRNLFPADVNDWRFRFSDELWMIGDWIDSDPELFVED